MTCTSLDKEYLDPLISLTGHLAEQQSNVLLQMLQGIERLECQRKYPEQPLELFNGSILAYYHMHEHNALNQQEHGHFHLFHCPDKQKDQAQHIVGLSMDHYGQPQAWFTVNQWVTDGICLDFEIFSKCLMENNIVKNDNRIEQWLSYILLIYRNIICDLLEESRISISDLSGETVNKRLAILNNRQIYIIKSKKIDLFNDISTVMSS